MLKAGPVTLSSLLPVEQVWNSQLLQHHACLHADILPAMLIADQTSVIVSQSQLKAFLRRVSVVMVSGHNNRALTKTLPDGLLINDSHFSF